MSSSSYRTTGWIAFAAVILGVVSLWNMTLGLSLIFMDNWVVFTEDGLVFLNTTGWGWLLLISGVVKFVTCYGLLTGQEWARVLGIAFVVVNLFEQFVMIGAAPWWGLVSIILSIFVLYALIVPEDPY